jgi:hypothetical protein
MNEQQTASIEIGNLDQTPNYTDDELIKVQQEQWISYTALGGLLTLEPESEEQTQQIKVMKIGEFAEKIGVDRSTLWRWKKSIPDFASRVRERRRELFNLSRETVLFNRAYLIATSSKDHKAAGDMIKLLLGHNADLELPVQRQVIKHGGDIRLSWADLMSRKKQEAMEAEIVNDPNLNQH